MNAKEVLVVNTSTANLASVLAGLRQAGACARISDCARTIEGAHILVLPGVGTFGAAMKQMRARGLVEPIAERIQERRPTLAICLGLQLLCEYSEESPGEVGLGIIPQVVRRLSSEVSVPHLGWNKVAPDSQCQLLEPGHAYFANSYCLRERPIGWNAAVTTHGRAFISAIESGPVLACQFHPELSGNWGIALLKRWLTSANC